MQADSGNNAVRLVVGGIITTVAGTLGVAGSTGNGGYAASSLLSNPIGVASDGAGGAVVTDFGNSVVRRVVVGSISSTPSQTPSATVTPSATQTPSPLPSPNPFWITLAAGTPGLSGYAGDGLPGSAGRLSAPFQVAADGLGGVVIGEVNNNLIRRLWGMRGGGGGGVRGKGFLLVRVVVMGDLGACDLLARLCRLAQQTEPSRLSSLASITPMVAPYPTRPADFTSQTLETRRCGVFLEAQR